MSPRDDAEGRCTFSLPGMAFARDGSGGEYHLLEDGSIGYYSSEGEAGRLAENMDDLFSLIVSCICWHDCCDAKHYVDSKTLEEYGQRQRNCNLEAMAMASWRRVSDALGSPADEPLAPVLERFRKATQDVYKRQEPEEWHNEQEKLRQLMPYKLPAKLVEYLKTGPLRLEFPEQEWVKWEMCIRDS